MNTPMNTEFITMYLPVLREKLVRLENRGRAGSDEAIRLRKAILDPNERKKAEKRREAETA